MIEIGRDWLAAVHGGDTSQNSFGVGPVSWSSSQTDYAKCVDRVVRETEQQYPSTAPWYNPFAVDTNAGPRAQATMENMRTVCGPPRS